MVEREIKDVLVIGAGPAGLAAAIEVASAGLACVCVDRLGPGGALINLGAIHEFGEEIAGPDLVARLTDQATAAGVELAFGEIATLEQGAAWTARTDSGESWSAHVVIVATGLLKGRLGLADEADWEGRGLSHCAICDGPLYAGQPVAVVGSGGWADHEAAELQALGAIVTRVSVDQPVISLEGTDGLEALVLERAGNRVRVPARAAFVYRDERPSLDFAPESLARDGSGHIVVDGNGRTALPSLFGAGDVRAGSSRHAKAALEDGRRAARAVIAALKRQVQ